MSSNKPRITAPVIPALTSGQSSSGKPTVVFPAPAQPVSSGGPTQNDAELEELFRGPNSGGPNSVSSSPTTGVVVPSLPSTSASSTAFVPASVPTLPTSTGGTTQAQSPFDPNIPTSGVPADLAKALNLKGSEVFGAMPTKSGQGDVDEEEEGLDEEEEEDGDWADDGPLEAESAVEEVMTEGVIWGDAPVTGQQLRLDEPPAISGGLAAAQNVLAQTDHLSYEEMTDDMARIRFAALEIVRRDWETKYMVMRAIMDNEKLPDGQPLVEALRRMFDVPGRSELRVTFKQSTQAQPTQAETIGEIRDRDEKAQLDARWLALKTDAERLRFLSEVAIKFPNWMAPVVKATQNPGQGQQGAVPQTQALTTQTQSGAKKGAGKKARVSIPPTPPTVGIINGPANPMLDKCKASPCDAARHQHQGGVGPCFKPECPCGNRCQAFFGPPLPGQEGAKSPGNPVPQGGQAQPGVATSSGPAAPQITMPSIPLSGPVAQTGQEVRAAGNTPAAPKSGGNQQPAGSKGPVLPGPDSGSLAAGVAALAGQQPSGGPSGAKTDTPSGGEGHGAHSSNQGVGAGQSGLGEGPRVTTEQEPVVPGVLQKMITQGYGGGPESSTYYPFKTAKQRAAGPGVDSRREAIAGRVANFWDRAIYVPSEGGGRTLRPDIDLRSTSYRVVLAANALAQAVEAFAVAANDEASAVAEAAVGQASILYRDAHKALPAGQLDCDWAEYLKYCEAFGLQPGVVLHEALAEQGATEVK